MERDKETDKILDICQINAKVGSFRLQDISLSLERGYIMGLTGRNGSGKTSLLNVICDSIPKQQGSIMVAGLDSVVDSCALKQEIGLVMEDFSFLPEVSLRENAMLFGMLYPEFDIHKWENYLLQYGVIKKSADCNGNLSALSKGQKVRFQMAFALAHNPKLLILDEPTANLDPVFRQHFLEDLQTMIAQETVSVVLCTHITSELDQIADYITILDAGKVCVSASKEWLLDTYRQLHPQERDKNRYDNLAELLEDMQHDPTVKKQLEQEWKKAQRQEQRTEKTAECPDTQQAVGKQRKKEKKAAHKKENRNRQMQLLDALSKKIWNHHPFWQGLLAAGYVLLAVCFALERFTIVHFTADIWPILAVILTVMYAFYIRYHFCWQNRHYLSFVSYLPLSRFCVAMEILKLTGKWLCSFFVAIFLIVLISWF